jgi:hypothetical protein
MMCENVKKNVNLHGVNRTLYLYSLLIWGLIFALLILSGNFIYVTFVFLLVLGTFITQLIVVKGIVYRMLATVLAWIPMPIITIYLWGTNYYTDPKVVFSEMTLLGYLLLIMLVLALIVQGCVSFLKSEFLNRA